MSLFAASASSPSRRKRKHYHSTISTAFTRFDESVEHNPPKLDEPRGKAIGAYATAVLKDGSRLLEVMSLEEIEKVRKVSRASGNGPWVQWWGEMARKGKAPTTRLQSAFRKFSRWLKRIYRAVANLNTPITPEIREVMDRMLATESEIAQAAEARAAYLQFDDAISAGMSEPDARRYAELGEQVRSEAEEQLTGKVMRSIRAREQKQWRDQEKAVRSEVERQVDGRPLFASLKLLRSKDGPRLDKAWLQEKFGEDVFGILPAGTPVWKQGGTNPDAMAELTGFSSGDQLVRELIGLEARRRSMKEGGDKRPVREAIISQEVKAEMNRRFGDPLADGTIEREASAAVQNDRLGEKLELELRALASKSNRKPTPYRMAREWARGRIEQGVIADMISGAAQYRYTRTAAKAARDAQAAILAGDMDAAFRHKQTELLHNALPSAISSLSRISSNPCVWGSSSAGSASVRASSAVNADATLPSMSWPHISRRVIGIGPAEWLCGALREPPNSHSHRHRSRPHRCSNPRYVLQLPTSAARRHGVACSPLPAPQPFEQGCIVRNCADYGRTSNGTRHRRNKLRAASLPRENPRRS